MQSILEACLETVESSLEVRLMAQEQGLKALELAELYRSQLERLQAGGRTDDREIRPNDEPERNATGVIVESDRARAGTPLPETGLRLVVDRTGSNARNGTTLSPRPARENLEAGETPGD